MTANRSPVTSHQSRLDKARRAKLRPVLHSPCLHLETSVEWFDDNGKLWTGSVAGQVPGRAVPAGECPVANVFQRRLEAALHWAEGQGLPVRIIGLKGRRSGSTTWSMKMVDLECRKRRTQALFMADVFKRSDTMIAMLGQFAQSDVFPWGFGAVAKAASIEYGNGSVALKETARDPNAGRAGGNRVVVFSEPAHYPTDGVLTADKLMMAALGTVPKAAGTIVVAESTANGQAGWFYERWTRAQWPTFADYWQRWDAERGEPDPDELWIRVFAAWFEIPRNRMPVNAEEKARILGKLTKTEQELVRRYALSAEQLKWRRVTIQSEFNGREAQFDQEFPDSPASAFIASGSPAFARDSMAMLRAAAEQAVPQWAHGCFDHPGASAADVREDRRRGVPMAFRRTPEEEALYSILEEPRDGCEYLMSIDPSSGQMVATEEGGAGRSKTSVLVWRKGYLEKDWQPSRLQKPRDRWHRPRLVARVRAEVMDLDPTENAVIYLIACLALYYGDCTVVIELNMGQWLIVLAKQAGLTLYAQTLMDLKHNRPTERLGFQQDEESRNTIISRLQALVHGSVIDPDPATKGAGAGETEIEFQPDVQIECLHVLGQMETFIRDKKAKWKGAPGKKDDDVLSAAMGLYLLENATRFRARRVGK